MSDALEIAAAVRAGSLKAADVVEQHLAAIDGREPEIHAFNLVMVEQARERAAAIDAMVAAGNDPGPLAGVPVALKDNMATAPTSTRWLAPMPSVVSTRSWRSSNAPTRRAVTANRSIL